MTIYDALRYLIRWRYRAMDRAQLHRELLAVDWAEQDRVFG